MIKYIYQFSLLFSVCLFIGSCTSEEEPIAKKADRTNSYAIRFNTSVLQPVATRATEAGNHYDPLNENVITVMDAFLYDASGAQQGYYSTRKGDLVISSGSNPANGAIADAVEGTATIYVPKDPGIAGAYTGKNYTLYVLVNYHGSENLEDKTLPQIRTIALNSSALNPNSIEKQKDFLMDGNVPTGSMTWATSNTYDITANTGKVVELSRAAAKIRLRVKEIDVKDGNEKFVLNGEPTVSLVNYSDKTSLLAGSPLSLSLSDLQSTEYQPMKRKEYEGEQFYARTVPFYSYENSWTHNGDFRTYLILRLNLTGQTTHITKDYYYSIPVNYLFPKPGMNEEQKAGISKLQRNHLYDIVCNIRQLGNLEPGKPTEITRYVTVQKWDEPDQIDGSISKAHYLVVKELTPEMPNIHVRDVQYLSDLDIDLSKLNIRTTHTEYDYLGNAHTVHGTNANGKIKITTIIKNGLKYLHIESPIPINYVPLTIDFRVQHVKEPGETGAPLFQDVKVTQYPPIYVTAEKSTGNPIYWYSAFGSYNRNGLDANGNPQAGYQQNNTLFKVTTLVPEEGQIVGDPTLGNSDGHTGRDEEANKITSPEFIIASQWGMSIPVPQYTTVNNVKYGWQKRLNINTEKFFIDKYRYWDEYYDYYYNRWITDWRTWRYRDYNNAESRAHNYWEDKYGKTGEKYIYGDQYGRKEIEAYRMFTFEKDGYWRIPSMAELALIVKIQSDPNSAVKNLLWGSEYWSAKNNYAYDFKNKKEIYKSAEELVAIRPVFDTYNK